MGLWSSSPCRRNLEEVISSRTRPLRLRDTVVGSIISVDRNSREWRTKAERPHDQATPVSAGRVAFSSSLNEREEIGDDYWELNDVINQTYQCSSIAPRRSCLSSFIRVSYTTLSSTLCAVLARPTGSGWDHILMRNLRHKDSSETF